MSASCYFGFSRTRKINGLLNAVHQQYHAALDRPFLDLVAPCPCPDILFYLCAHLIGQDPGGGQEHSPGRLLMLRLGKQIVGHPPRVRAFIGDNEHLAGAGHRIDRNEAETEEIALGGGLYLFLYLLRDVRMLF